jgi:hypothetical protein
MSIDIQDGTMYNISLQAQGEGSTMVPSGPVDVIDFGNRTTNILCNKTFKLENKGRRTQTITWTNEKTIKNKKANSKSEEEPLYFRILPEKAILPYGSSQEFVVHGYSSFPQSVSEKIICHTVIDKISSVLFESEVKCKFDNPLLKFENPLVFTWNYAPGTVPTKQVNFIQMHYIDYLD